ncbi:TetR/AcrR family transcriptional regulator [uncultured Bacteroides sp.]|uniref:TetR/AcrR family transcriptional regulator n=1 Tax=uncultured Bacteroides sp. TaxID=162156 RepID=UPI0026010A99|nr:TetR/AcrR family transcriptional regulator [uncultured Bacteroides sp.]
MITNREEVLENAFKVFIKMNYEKASFTEIAKACGLSRAGIIHYFPYKQDLFVAVVDKFVFQLHHPENKFNLTECTLQKFIQRYIEGINTTLNRFIPLIDDGNNPYKCCPNFYYYHFFSQVKMYYPNFHEKASRFFEQDYRIWNTIVQKAKDNGEIRPDTDVKKAATLFRQMYFGLSYEQSFLNGLNINELEENFNYIYSLLKA